MSGISIKVFMEGLSTNKYQLRDELEVVDRNISRIKEEILVLMAMAPETRRDEDGSLVYWEDHIVNQLELLWGELNYYMYRSGLIYYALEFPEDVKEENEPLPPNITVPPLSGKWMPFTQNIDSKLEDNN